MLFGRKKWKNIVIEIDRCDFNSHEISSLHSIPESPA